MMMLILLCWAQSLEQSICGFPMGGVHTSAYIIWTGACKQLRRTSLLSEDVFTSAASWAAFKMLRTSSGGPECAEAASTCCMYCWHAFDTMLTLIELDLRTR